MFTVRDHIGDDAALDKTFERMAEIGYTEAQTAGRESAEYAKIAKKHGITIVGTHYSYEEIINNVDATIKLHEALGTTNVGIGAMPYAARTDVEEFYRFVENFNKASEIYAKHGYKLTYHNHAFEFSRSADGRIFMDKLIEDFPPELLGITLDTYWVQFGGADPAAWLKRLKGRVECVHLKDMTATYKNGNRMAPVGYGNMDFERIIDAAGRAGTKYLLAEQDDCYEEDPFECLRKSYGYLTSLGLK